MKKWMSLLMAFVITFALFPVVNADAELADGKYSLPYQVNKAGSTSASIANDYFMKPATLIKKDGVMYVQLTLTKSSQFVKFEAPTGGNQVVATDAANDRRTVQFNLTQLANAQTVNVRLEIPEEDYYHNYKIDFVWFTDKAKLIESYAAPVKEVAKPVETKPAQTKPTETKVKETTKPAVTEATKETTKEETKVAPTENKEAAKTEEASKKPEQDDVKTEAVAEESKEQEKEESTQVATITESKTEDKTEEKTIAVASAETNEQATANTTTEQATESGSQRTIMWLILALAIVFAVTGGYGYYKKFNEKK